MVVHYLRFLRLVPFAFAVCLVALLPLQTTGLAQATQSSPAVRSWQSAARLHRAVKLGTTSGVLIFDQTGIHFQPSKGTLLNWSFLEIQTFHLAPRELRLKTYANRGWRLPGVKTFRFTLTSPVPPAVAAELAARVGKPSRNGDPNRRLPAFATIPARHLTLLGGSNGVLRFGRDGIDYVTPSGPGSRSWRWNDIQTLANPDAYHFQVYGYLETFNFELKEPMSQALFNRLWDYVYGRGLQLGIHSRRGTEHARPGAANEMSSGGRQNAAPVW